MKLQISHHVGGRGGRANRHGLAARSTSLVCAFAAILFASVGVAQSSDTTPPQLVSFTFSPASVDVSLGSQQVMATLVVTDDLSGTASVGVGFISPSGQQSQFRFLPRVSGTGLNGTWEGPITIPQFSEAGVWRVSAVQLRDAVGNLALLNEATLRAAGFPTELTVVSVQDTTPPQLTSLVLNPSAVDVSGGNQQIRVTLGLSDDSSGVTYACMPAFCYYAIGVRSPSGRQQYLDANYNFRFVSGTPLASIWEVTLTLPRFCEPGAWTISFLQSRDNAANFRVLSTAAIQALGFPTIIDVASSPADTSPPQLFDFRFSPILINTSTGAQRVTVDLGVADDLSGADFFGGFASPNFNLAQIIFRSPSGAQRQFLTPYNFTSRITLISGTSLNGMWQGALTFPRFSEEGTWTVESVSIRDGVANFASFNTAALRGMGFPTEMTVVKPSLVVDGTITDPAVGGTVMDTVFGPRAQITFPPGVLSTSTSVAIDVFESPLQIPTPSGFAGPGTRFVNIELSPEPAYPLPAPGLTVVLPLINPMPAGERIDLFRVDPATGNLVAAIGVDGQPVVGTVNADGLSATFSGVARLSIVVGLTPEIIDVEIDIKPGSFPNSINPGSEGTTPIAVLGSATFDAREVSPTTVTLADAPVKLKPNGTPMASFEDVNSDGLLDLVVHVITGQMNLNPGDTVATLRGKTLDRLRIRGIDSVQVIP